MPRRRLTALFFARVADPHLIELIEFYREDVMLLRAMGYEVVVETSILRAVTSRCDLCFAWWWPTALPVVAAYRLRRRPAIVTGTLDIFEPLQPASRKVKAAIKIALTFVAVRLATASIVVSNSEAARMRPYRPHRHARLHCGIDTAFFDRRPKTARPTIVTVGQLNEGSMRRKGIDLLIQSMALVRRSVPDARLVIAGPISADGQRYFETLRQGSDVSGVELRGEISREAKRDLLAAAWAYSQPSRDEGFGLAVAEAMACGTVAVVTPAGALGEVVGDAGVVVAWRNANALAAALVTVLTQEAYRTALEGKSRERAVALFDRVARTRRAASLFRSWKVPTSNAGTATPHRDMAPRTNLTGDFCCDGNPSSHQRI